MKLDSKTSIFIIASLAMVCAVAICATTMIRMSANPSEALAQPVPEATVTQEGADAVDSIDLISIPDVQADAQADALADEQPGLQCGNDLQVGEPPTPQNANTTNNGTVMVVQNNVYNQGATNAQTTQAQSPASKTYHFEVASVGFEIPEQWAELANTPVTDKGIEFKVPGSNDVLLSVRVKKSSDPCTGGDAGTPNLFQIDNGKGQRVEFWLYNWGYESWQQVAKGKSSSKYSRDFLEKALTYQTGGTVSYSQCGQFSNGCGQPLFEFVEKNICATARVM